MWNGSRWSAAQRGVLVSVGYRGGTSAGNRSPPHAAAVAEERSARPSKGRGLGQLRARDAGVLSSSSDPS